MIKRFIRIGIVPLVLTAVTLGAIPIARAISTVPSTFVYNGHLLDSSGVAITTEHSIRFSFWTDSDYITGNVTAAGAINEDAPTYADWQEIFTVTPNSDGYFTVDLGSTTAFPAFSSYSSDTLLNLHMQIEVKASGDADTAYELLDRNASDETVDRSPLLAVPFAFNAMNAESLNIKFGAGISKVLSYDSDNSYFNFSDRVNIQGDLTLTGGLILGNYEPASGTGAGTLRWTGSDFEGYDGTNWKSLTSGDKFVGVSTETMDGSFSKGNLVGYQAANSYCNDDFLESHMCQMDEIITTIDKNITSFSGISNAWVSEGAPGYTSDSNDCQGWSSDNNSHLGAWWEFSTDAGATVAAGGGQGYLTNCAVVQPIACCR